MGPQTHPCLPLVHRRLTNKKLSEVDEEEGARQPLLGLRGAAPCPLSSTPLCAAAGPWTPRARSAVAATSGSGSRGWGWAGAGAGAGAVAGAGAGQRQGQGQGLGSGGGRGRGWGSGCRGRGLAALFQPAVHFRIRLRAAGLQQQVVRHHVRVEPSRPQGHPPAPAPSPAPAPTPLSAPWWCEEGGWVLRQVVVHLLQQVLGEGAPGYATGTPPPIQPAKKKNVLGELSIKKGIWSRHGNCSAQGLSFFFFFYFFWL